MAASVRHPAHDRAARFAPSALRSFVMDEVRLEGGRQTAGVVRVGDTVRRPPHRNSRFVRAVLRHLEAVGFTGAPRLLGVDEAGREILSFIDGEVHVAAPGEPEPLLSDAQLASAAGLIRRFHDATAGSALAGGEEVVCHGDLGPHNTVFAGDEAVGLVDWDEDVAPGPRLVDLGHAVWCFADVGESGGPVEEQGRRIHLMCGAYGWDDPGAVVDEIAEMLERARDRHARAGRDRAVRVFEELMGWMAEHREQLRAACVARQGPYQPDP
jgi:Phosphotransferase enzyme family